MVMKLMVMVLDDGDGRWWWWMKNSGTPKLDDPQTREGGDIYNFFPVQQLNLLVIDAVWNSKTFSVDIYILIH